MGLGLRLTFIDLNLRLNWLGSTKSPIPRRLRDCTVNYKGFIGDRVNNTGEDKGYYIDTGNDLLKGYSTGKEGNNYRIIVTKDEKEIGKLNIKLDRPKMDYLVLKANNDRHILLRPDEAVTFSLKDYVLLEAIKANPVNNSGIKMEVNGHKIGIGETCVIGDLCKSTPNKIYIKKGSLSIARIFVDIN